MKGEEAVNRKKVIFWNRLIVVTGAVLLIAVLSSV
jgi:hypothetical protein